MKIRPEHYEAYLDSRVGQARRRIAAAVRRQLPQQTADVSEENLLELCDRAMHRCAGYGIGTENNIYYFACAMILCGEQFEDDPVRTWKQDFLEDALMDQDLKGKLLALNVEVETGQGL
jgi:hypothetical protein